jgi:hypothetical protein
MHWWYLKVAKVGATALKLHFSAVGLRLVQMKPFYTPEALQ